LDEKGRVGRWGGWGSGEDREKVRSRGILELTSTSWRLVIEIRSGRFWDEVALVFGPPSNFTGILIGGRLRRVKSLLMMFILLHPYRPHPPSTQTITFPIKPGDFPFSSTLPPISHSPSSSPDEHVYKSRVHLAADEYSIRGSTHKTESSKGI